MATMSEELRQNWAAPNCQGCIPAALMESAADAIDASDDALREAAINLPTIAVSLRIYGNTEGAEMVSEVIRLVAIARNAIKGS